MPVSSVAISKYGMAISSTITTVGMMTPARLGCMWSRSSCRFRKYHGAFEGFGVWLGFATSSSGAFTNHAITTRPMTSSTAEKNSGMSRWGHVVSCAWARRAADRMARADEAPPPAGAAAGAAGLAATATGALTAGAGAARAGAGAAEVAATGAGSGAGAAAGGAAPRAARSRIFAGVWSTAHTFPCDVQQSLWWGV